MRGPADRPCVVLAIELVQKTTSVMRSDIVDVIIGQHWSGIMLTNCQVA